MSDLQIIRGGVENPRISIIIPVYNAERTLERAVESVLKQDFSDFELILVNDCSTDKTLTSADNWQVKTNVSPSWTSRKMAEPAVLASLALRWLVGSI